MYSVWKIKIGGEHGAVEGGKAQLVEQMELDAGEIAVGEKRLGMCGDGCEVETFEEVIRSVAAAEGHDGAGCWIGKSGVKIGEALSGGSREVERLAKQCVGAWRRHEAKSRQGRKAAFGSLRIRGRRGRDDGDLTAQCGGWRFDQARHLTMPLRER